MSCNMVSIIEKKSWKKPEVNQEDSRVKELMGKTSVFFEKIGIPKEFLNEFPTTVILPNGNESWAQGIVFVGYKSLNVTKTEEVEAEKVFFTLKPKGTVLNLQTDKDKDERVADRMIFIGKDEPTISFPSEIPISIQNNITGGSIEGGLSQLRRLYNYCYLLINEGKPDAPHKIKGFLIFTSNEFVEKDIHDHPDRKDRFGREMFVLTEVTPLNK
jgi:hypothetical protein